MATLFVDKLDPQSGTALEIGSSGDTITIPSGATITNSGTANGFGKFTFYAYKTGSAQGISQSTFTKCTLDTELFDTNSGFASDKYTFTASTAGTYYIFGNIFHGGSGSISSAMQTITQIKLNGSTDLFYNNKYSTQTGTPETGYVMVHGCKTFSDGDYIELFGYNSLATSPTFEAGTGYYTFMGGYKIA